jgi:hypothetical protein
MRIGFVRLLPIWGLLALGACHSTRNAPVVAKAPPGQAQLVFLRPTKTLQQVSLYLLDTGQQQFLGVVEPGTKLVSQVPPGDHLFMVVAEQEAEFMQTHLDAGKTYYALVRGRYDKNADWHFFLLPIHRDSADSYNIHDPTFRKWERATRLRDKSPDDDLWYAENRSSIDSRRDRYLDYWNQRSSESKARLTLYAEDGVVALEPMTYRSRRDKAGTVEPEDDEP